MITDLPALEEKTRIKEKRMSVSSLAHVRECVSPYLQMSCEALHVDPCGASAYLKGITRRTCRVCKREMKHINSTRHIERFKFRSFFLIMSSSALLLNFFYHLEPRSGSK